MKDYQTITLEIADDWGMIWGRYPAKGPTLAYRNLKRPLRESWQNGFDAQLTLEAELQGDLGGPREFKEGVVAFHDKRTAGFEGR